MAMPTLDEILATFTPVERQRYERFKSLWPMLTILPTDYRDYGGAAVRWDRSDRSDADCSCGCKYALYLDGSGDWLVCANPHSPRRGLLTWEHQAGRDCYVPDEADETVEQVSKHANASLACP